MEMKACKINNKNEELQQLLEITNRLLKQPKQAEAFFIKAKIYTPTGKLNIKYR